MFRMRLPSWVYAIGGAILNPIVNSSIAGYNHCETFVQIFCYALQRAWILHQRHYHPMPPCPFLPGEYDFTTQIWMEWTANNGYQLDYIADRISEELTSREGIAIALMALYYHARAAGRAAKNTSDVQVAQCVAFLAGRLETVRRIA
jgi:hypothetical protein